MIKLLLIIVCLLNFWVYNIQNAFSYPWHFQYLSFSFLNETIIQEK